ncbi:hypothetical protein TNCV_1033281 [Trichonephila clavipes]|nr:hypothetical protein TNCV_1033281 [Trichonephila clavipes]
MHILTWIFFEESVGKNKTGALCYIFIRLKPRGYKNVPQSILSLSLKRASRRTVRNNRRASDELVRNLKRHKGPLQSAPKSPAVSKNHH